MVTNTTTYSLHTVIKVVTFVSDFKRDYSRNCVDLYLRPRLSGGPRNSIVSKAETNQKPIIILFNKIYSFI